MAKMQDSGLARGGAEMARRVLGGELLDLGTRLMGGDGDTLGALKLHNALLNLAGPLSAVESGLLPDVVIHQDPELVTQYVVWRIDMWEQCFEGLLDGGVLPAVRQIRQLVRAGVTTQVPYRAVLMPAGMPVPTVVGLCDELSRQIARGQAFLPRLRRIADGIVGADAGRVSALCSLAARLSGQFATVDQRLQERALDHGRTMVATLIDVGVGLGLGETPLSPLPRSLAQIGLYGPGPLSLPSGAKITLAALTTLWRQMDAPTRQAARLALLINHLADAVGARSRTAETLDEVRRVWRAACEVVGGDAKHWRGQGQRQIADWAERMGRVEFMRPVAQIVAC